MEKPQFALRRVTPWVVSGASSIYALKRARRLSLAEADSASLGRFLASQSDVILLMFGGHIVWHLTARYRSAELARLQRLLLSPSTEPALHQLRETFSVLTLGTELLARRISKGKTTELLPLIARLQKSVAQGARLIIELDREAPATSAWQARVAGIWRNDGNGTAHKRDSFPTV